MIYKENFSTFVADNGKAKNPSPRGEGGSRRLSDEVFPIIKDTSSVTA